MLTALIPFVLKNWRYFALGAAALAAFAWFEVEQHKAYTEGQQAAVQQVEKANVRSQQLADRAAKNVDDCFARGGDWDRAHGVCHFTAGK